MSLFAAACESDIREPAESERAVAGSRRGTSKPELLAPAGDRECLTAAVENGADAVYFGLQRFNARIRAANFDGADLPEVMGFLHRRGVRGYVALNTLVFPAELEAMEGTIRELTLAGVDAVIVQDLGLTRLIRSITPDLEIHASTQMSVTSAEGVELARELGCSRVILARELSLKEIGRIRKEVDLPLEVFVHGALCVAYSGQCLTSEALGGRSANRGECAQACRMPYEIVCDGKTVDMGNVQYLLSPQDLAAFDLIPQLIDLGVSSLKIEGRLKTAEYVANITKHYRHAIDMAWAERRVNFSSRDIEEMQLSFSRGFSHGFLDGNDHKVLVRGDYAKKRGISLGVVESVTRGGVRLRTTAVVKPGDGLVFDGDEAQGIPEQGGRVYEVERMRRDAKADVTGPMERNELVELRFGRESVDARRIVVGQQVWKTDDPELTKRLRKSYQGAPSRKVELSIRVRAKTGELLTVTGKTATGLEVTVYSAERLAVAQTIPADSELIVEQMSRMGGTVYDPKQIEAEVLGGPMVPKSMLNQARRELVAKLDTAAAMVGPRSVAKEPVLSRLFSEILVEREQQVAARAVTAGCATRLSVLCRTTEQVEAAAGMGIGTIYVDFQDIKKYSEAVLAAHRHGARILIASPRIEKPGEANLFGFLAKQAPDGLLVRNAGGLAFCSRKGIPFVADFSLNAANALTVEILKARGAERVTASYDLNVEQLVALIASTPPEWLEIVIHQQVPMFHMEHCVFCAFLSPGTDKTNCGRPCDVHEVKLRDRVGAEHPLTADVGCRNTLYNATPQSAAEYLPRFVASGARHFRIEFLEEYGADVERVIGLYREVLEGGRDARKLFRELNATGQYGVTRGALAIL